MKVVIDKRIWKMNENVSDAIQDMLTDIWNLVNNTAKKNAPYLSWTLRKSISVDFDNIEKWIVVVWSDVKYAKRREFENKKNPDRRYYLLRWYRDNRAKISAIVINALTKKLK